MVNRSIRFIRRRGGINKCAARFTRCLGRWEVGTRRGELVGLRVQATLNWRATGRPQAEAHNRLVAGSSSSTARTLAACAAIASNLRDVTKLPECHKRALALRRWRNTLCEATRNVHARLSHRRL
jgi:hypothetical protein